MIQEHRRPAFKAPQECRFSNLIHAKNNLRIGGVRQNMEEARAGPSLRTVNESRRDRQPNVSKRWSHSTNLQRQNWSQTLLTRGTEYDFTSLRALSASPPTIRASRKNSAPRPLYGHTELGRASAISTAGR